MSVEHHARACVHDSVPVIARLPTDPDFSVFVLFFLRRPSSSSFRLPLCCLILSPPSRCSFASLHRLSSSLRRFAADETASRYFIGFIRGNIWRSDKGNWPSGNLQERRVVRPFSLAWSALFTYT